MAIASRKVFTAFNARTAAAEEPAGGAGQLSRPGRVPPEPPEPLDPLDPPEPDEPPVAADPPLSVPAVVWPPTPAEVPPEPAEAPPALAPLVALDPPELVPALPPVEPARLELPSSLSLHPA
jgi:hypothetical protein